MYRIFVFSFWWKFCILYYVFQFCIGNWIRRISEKGRVYKIRAWLYEIVQNVYKIMAQFLFWKSKMVGYVPPPLQIWIANTGEGAGVQNCMKCVQNYGTVFILKFENGGAGDIDLIATVIIIHIHPFRESRLAHSGIASNPNKGPVFSFPRSSWHLVNKKIIIKKKITPTTVQICKLENIEHKRTKQVCYGG